MSTVQAQLRDLIAKYFNDEELRHLCFDLGIPYDDLGGEGKIDKAHQLIAHGANTRDLLSKLRDALPRFEAERDVAGSCIARASIPNTANTPACRCRHVKRSNIQRLRRAAVWN